jgi:hypothetical protein
MQMKAEEFSKNILSLDPKIRFAGLIERSGHLFAGGEREGLNEHLKRCRAEFVPICIYSNYEECFFSRTRRFEIRCLCT